MSATQPTVTTPTTSRTGTTTRDRITQTDWDKTITDGGIYLLALGGFYVGYQTLYTQALLHGMPADQAAVVSALADLAILLFSRKAVREVKAGRSAWGIRFIVAAFSLATFGLQLRAAWGDPLAVLFHALPPAVWIIGHEMMLRGRLRDAKAKLRAAQITAGLRPAPLPSIRLSWWLLDPYHTFIVWRLTKLWEIGAPRVIRKEAAKLQAKDKDVPRAWEGYLAATTMICGAAKTYKIASMMPKPTTVPQITAVLYRESDPTVKVPASEIDAFVHMLPEPPAKGRPEDKAIEYIRRVDNLATQRDIKITGVFLAELLQVDAGRISKLRKAMTTHP